jgi:hypothetical protein
MLRLVSSIPDDELDRDTVSTIVEAALIKYFFKEKGFNEKVVTQPIEEVPQHFFELSHHSKELSKERLKACNPVHIDKFYGERLIIPRRMSYSTLGTLGTAGLY